MASASTEAKVTRYLDQMGKPRTPKGRARLTTERLAECYPGTAKELCALDHDNPFQLLTATILSAQTTDARVNMVTPALFARYPDPAALAAANPEEVEEIIRTTGFFRSKAKSLIGMATALCERFGGTVPTDLTDLVTIPGVGRKTGNVVRSVDFDLPGLPVDTHVLRVSDRLGLLEGLTPNERRDAVKVEIVLNAFVPAAERGTFSLRMILHGRETCVARKPHCDACPLADFCPSVQLTARDGAFRPF
jgi:endonuclease-3